MWPKISNSSNTSDQLKKAIDWDQWWQEKLSTDQIDRYIRPFVQAPLVEYQGELCDIANNTHLLIKIMKEFNLRKILCAGSGVSYEPVALAEAGFDVTALDISSTAIRIANMIAFDPECRIELGANPAGPSDSLDFVPGDLLDPAVCPGPFDMIIERRTIQTFSEQDRPAALKALAARLGEVGVLLSHCNYGGCSLAPGGKLFHGSESWFNKENWIIWDGAPGLILKEQVAWLIRTAA